MLFSKLGLLSDPNPNPVGFGIMAMFTFWPGLVLILGGVLNVAWNNRKQHGA